MKRNMKIQKELIGRDYLLLGLLCVGGLTFDVIAFFIDHVMYGEKANEGFTKYAWYMNITHWIFVIIIWTLIIVGIWKFIKRNNVLDDLFQISLNKNDFKYSVLAIIFSLLFTFIENIIEPGIFPQILGEFIKFQSRFGDNAIYVSIIQNIYYLVEAMLVVLLLSLMQKAGEKWFKNPKIPYGSIGLMLTWGSGHLMHGLIPGLWIMGFSLIAGELFLLNKKSIWPTYLFIVLIFIV